MADQNEQTANNQGLGGGADRNTEEDNRQQLSSNDTEGNDKGNGRDTESNGGLSLVDKAKDTASTIVDQAKSGAGGAFDAAKDKAASLIDDRKTQFTEGLTGVAETVRKASETIGEGDAESKFTEYATKYTGTAADKIEGIAKYFDENDLRAIFGDVESFARKNPAIFLGGAFALGIVAARFIKSSPPERELAAGAAAKRSGRKSSSTNKRTDTAEATA